MPTYEYICRSCEHEFEEFQPMSARPLRKCPECAKSTLERKIGLGGGIIFKGGGFYETDYRSDSYKKAADADTKSASGTDEKKKTDHVHNGSCPCGKKPADQCASTNAAPEAEPEKQTASRSAAVKAPPRKKTASGSPAKKKSAPMRGRKPKR